MTDKEKLIFLLGKLDILRFAERRISGSIGEFSYKEDVIEDILEVRMDLMEELGINVTDRDKEE